MKPITSVQRISVPTHVLVSEVHGELILLNLVDECYYGLDEVGARFWTVLTTSPSIHDAWMTLVNEYDVEPDVLMRDLEDLIDSLADHGLMEVHDE